VLRQEKGLTGLVLSVSIENIYVGPRGPSPSMVVPPSWFAYKTLQTPPPPSPPPPPPPPYECALRCACGLWSPVRQVHRYCSRVGFTAPSGMTCRLQSLFLAEREYLCKHNYMPRPAYAQVRCARGTMPHAADPSTARPTTANTFSAAMATTTKPIALRHTQLRRTMPARCDCCSQAPGRALSLQRMPCCTSHIHVAGAHTAGLLSRPCKI